MTQQEKHHEMMINMKNRIDMINMTNMIGIDQDKIKNFVVIKEIFVVMEEIMIIIGDMIILILEIVHFQE